MSGIFVLILRILAAGALYLFIGWAFHTLWKDLRSASPTTEQAPTLKVVQPGAEANPHTFDLPIITIGRSENSTLRLQDSSISSSHARMSYHHQQWWLEDLGSTNGTRLNNQAVSSPIILVNGDQVQCGSVILQVLIER
jgi:pSer/pThr/pTyr-binding forkhead associated (FHA) protein